MTQHEKTTVKSGVEWGAPLAFASFVVFVLCVTALLLLDDTSGMDRRVCYEHCAYIADEHVPACIAACNTHTTVVVTDEHEGERP